MGERAGRALCLSGGGYRATLLHTGALLRLDELGLLASVDTVSGSSGGSLAAALLTDPGLDWPPAPGRVDGLDRFVATVLEVTGTNTRTPALLARLRPRGWARRDAAVRELARRLTAPAPALAQPMVALGTRPRVVVTATDLTFGDSWLFSGPTAGGDPARMGSDRAGFVPVPPSWTVGETVAVSCAVPPFFAPRRVERSDLVDGAVFDALALEPVWRTHAELWVSDGGGVFAAGSARTFFGRLLRAAEVQGRASQLARLDWLQASEDAGLLSAEVWDSERSPNRGYPDDVAMMVAAVRTDLDAFSAGEQRVIVNHGYAVADSALGGAEDFTFPFQEYADPDVARRALDGSAARSLLGRR